MTIMVDTQRALTGGVDTHADVHVAAVIDPHGGLLGVESFTTDLAGHKLLSAWMCAFGEIGLVGGGRYRLLRGRPRPSPASSGSRRRRSRPCHTPTKVYVARRTAEGRSKREIIRILKRYVAREVYHYLPRD